MNAEGYPPGSERDSQDSQFYSQGILSARIQERYNNEVSEIF